jgi:hypothetical protein
MTRIRRRSPQELADALAMCGVMALMAKEHGEDDVHNITLRLSQMFCCGFAETITNSGAWSSKPMRK